MDFFGDGSFSKVMPEESELSDLASKRLTFSKTVDNLLPLLLFVLQFGLIEASLPVLMLNNFILKSSKTVPISSVNIGVSLLCSETVVLLIISFKGLSLGSFTVDAELLLMFGSRASWKLPFFLSTRYV